MTTLHIFNPEHEIALAANLRNFTPPHAGRQLRHDLGYLPVLWACPDDAVLVDDVETAERGCRKLMQALRRCGLPAPGLPAGGLVTHVRRMAIDDVDAWGWDAALCARLERAGVPAEILPDENRLEQIRNLAHRRTAARLLPLLQGDGTVGEACECRSEQEVADMLARHGRVVMKAPWSSSGRGLRFLDVERTPLSMQSGWLRNMMAAQGSVMAEPYYHKVKDFAMEFSCRSDGSVHYDGLSLFHTMNGAYQGNVLATEKVKREVISNFISIELLDYIKEKVCSCLPALLQDSYQGPLGIDMMLVASPHGDSQCLLHPCVEINLRRTMGHVALRLSPTDDDVQRVMRVEYADGSYRLRVSRL